MKLRFRLVLTTLAVCLPVAAMLAFFQFLLLDNIMEASLVQYVLTTMQTGGRQLCETSPETWSLSHPRPPRPSDLEDAPDPDGPGPDGPPADAPPMPPNTFGGRPPSPPFGRPMGPPLGRPPHHRGHDRAEVFMPIPVHFEIFAYDRDWSSRNSDAPAILQDSDVELEPGESVNGRFATGGMEGSQQTLLRMPWDDGPCVYLLIFRRHDPPFSLLDRRFWMPIQFWLLPILSVLIALFLSVGPVVSRVQRLTKEVIETKNAQYEPKITVGGGDEIGELARAFEEAGREVRAQISEVERREQTLRRFLENTTHDVMIPLTVLQGHLSEMTERMNQEQPVEKAQVSNAVSEAHYIGSLIHNLSIAAKIEEGEPAVQRAPVNLNDVILRAIERHRMIARQKRVLLDFAVPEQPLWTEADVTFIQQAVNNVILNAIRYHHPEGHVAVILEPNGEQDFRLRVIDDGPGIPEEETKLILDRFYRGNQARQREPEGQGLGLNIAYQMALLHGWTFTLKASEFGGLEIEFSGARRTPPTLASEDAALDPNPCQIPPSIRKPAQ